MRDKRERFVSLAEARTDKAIRAIRLVGNLSNRSNYEYDEDEAVQIVRALEKEVRALKLRFEESGISHSQSFRLRTTSGQGN